MKFVRWVDRRGWFFPLCAVLVSALSLLTVGKWLLRQLDDSAPTAIFLLEAVFLAAAAAACVLVPWMLGQYLRQSCAVKELIAATSQSAQACDPEILVDTCRDLQSAWARGPWRAVNMAVQLALATALQDLGRIREGEQELDRLLPVYEHGSMNVKLSIEVTAVAVKLRAGKESDARSYLAELEQHLGSRDFGQGQAALENVRSFFRLMTEGGSEELLAQYQKMLESTTSPVGKAAAHMDIARCLLDLDRREEALPHLQFVADHGGKLAIRAEAQARLAESENAAGDRYSGGSQA